MTAGCELNGRRRERENHPPHLCDGPGVLGGTADPGQGPGEAPAPIPGQRSRAFSAENGALAPRGISRPARKKAHAPCTGAWAGRAAAFSPFSGS